MKNILKILCLCCLSLLFLSAMNSCQDDNEEIEEAVLPDGQEQDSTSGNLTASIVDGLYVNWSKGDMIMLVYDGQAVRAETQESGSTSILSGTVGSSFTEDNPLYGVYPADNVVSSDRESVTITVPATQTGGGSGYDEKSVVVVARTISESLAFRTIGGGIKLNFQMSGVTKVELESVDGYALSGTAGIK